MATVSDVASLLAERTSPELAAPWDPVGLQLGEPGRTVEKIAVCHEVTEDVVARVEETPVDLLITYHPLLFSPVNRLVAGRSPAARALRLLTVGVSLMVTHTDFDACPGGAADALATALGLGDVAAFGADELEGRPSIGRVGSMTGSLGDVAKRVEDTLGHIGVRVSGEEQVSVAAVAVVPGSGSDLIASAAEMAEVLVTGDVSHHRCVAALDLGLAVIDPGHIATERPGMVALLDLVRSLTDLPVLDLTTPSPATWG